MLAALTHRAPRVAYVPAISFSNSNLSETAQAKVTCFEGILIFQWPKHFPAPNLYQSVNKQADGTVLGAFSSTVNPQKGQQPDTEREKGPE